MIDIIVPTYGRWEQIGRVSRNIHEMTSEEHRVVWVIEDDDAASWRAVPASDVRVRNVRSKSYAGAVNTAVLASDADLWFCAADDVVFHEGWDTRALLCLDGWFQVVGTNDLLNPYVRDGIHATHYLVARDYVTQYGSGVIDSDEPVLLFEGYDHNFTDTEFVGTAKARCRFRPCLDSVVEHRHHANGRAAWDATYRKGAAEVEQDRVLYELRRPLWQDLAV
jgi:hypothetical protein